MSTCSDSACALRKMCVIQQNYPKFQFSTEIRLLFSKLLKNILHFTSGISGFEAMDSSMFWCFNSRFLSLSVTKCRPRRLGVDRQKPAADPISVETSTQNMIIFKLRQSNILRFTWLKQLRIDLFLFACFTCGTNSSKFFRSERITRRSFRINEAFLLRCNLLSQPYHACRADSSLNIAESLNNRNL